MIASVSAERYTRFAAVIEEVVRVMFPLQSSLLLRHALRRRSRHVELTDLAHPL